MVKEREEETTQEPPAVPATWPEEFALQDYAEGDLERKHKKGSHRDEAEEKHKPYKNRTHHHHHHHHKPNKTKL
jgi:hypothetical protein